MIGLLGIIAILGLAYLLSNNRNKIKRPKNQKALFDWEEIKW